MWNIQTFTELPSTQALAKQKLQSGDARHGDVFAAMHQTEGRGRYADRIWHVHFKDHDPRIAEQSRREGWNALQSIEHGVFCELGQGDIDFPAILAKLNELNYQGWIVVEQDVLPGMGSPKASSQRNREYLRSIGV